VQSNLALANIEVCSHTGNFSCVYGESGNDEAMILAAAPASCEFGLIGISARIKKIKCITADYAWLTAPTAAAY
jgi:hypothetical protein